MDVVSLVLVFLFFILPIIQQVLERSRQGGPAEGAPEEETGEEVGEREVARESRAPLPPEPVAASKNQAPEGWSESWGSWPSDAPQPRSAPDPAPEPERGHNREVVRSEQLVRQPPLEKILAPEVDRLESQRAVGLLGRPIGGGAAISRGAPALRVQKGRSRGAMLPLQNAADLRRAILLSEVLGPPVSMRGKEDRR